MLTPFLIAAALTAHSSPVNGRKLVFDCEFARSKHISLKDWKFDDGPVYNNEKERYVSAEGPNAHITKAGLEIVATKVGGKIMSARLLSTHAWKYGYFEFTAKVPSGRGTWPALWLLNDCLRHKGPENVGWPRCGEIDVMENVGFDPTNFHFSLHSQDFNFMQKNQRTRVVPCSNPFEWHTFGLDWRAESIQFYLDGKKAYRVDRTKDTPDDWPFRSPFYLILNLAIGGDWGGAKGIDDAIFPAKFTVRNVKIYQ